MLLYLSDSFLQHDTGSHPECIARIENVNATLREGTDGQPSWTEKCTCPNWDLAQPEQLTRVHSQEYIQQLENWCKNDAGQVESDTYVCPGTWGAALNGAGASTDAVQRVIRGESSTAFCAIRPPGHHALPSGPMGFCVLNNVAVAAEAALSAGLDRVLIVDWDVHHGNGTQDAFYESDRVGFYSIHRSPFYPGTGSQTETGTRRGLGWTLNCPVTAGILKQQFFDRFQSGLDQIAAKVKPELILLSAGFDAHREDPVGGLCLESGDFAKLTRQVRDVANAYCEGKLVSLLEGGYHLQHLPESVDVHVDTLYQSMPESQK